MILKYIISFLVLINPIVMFIYLQPVIRRLPQKTLGRVIAHGSLVAFTVFFVFALVGNVFFKDILQIKFDSFRIFGGLIIAYFSIAKIAQGRTSIITYDDDHASIANQIAMPLLIGAGTISLSIIIGNKYDPFTTAFILAAVLIINYLALVLLTKFREKIMHYFAKDFDSYMEGILRLFAFFAGAIGIDMIVTGIKNLL
jgi:multiple antibiotic resistance protein